MTTYEMTRCKKCSYCEQDANGNFICKETGEDIHRITDEECPVEQEY